MLPILLLLACTSGSSDDTGIPSPGDGGASDGGADGGASDGGADGGSADGGADGGTEDGGADGGAGDGGAEELGPQVVFINEILAANEATLVGPTGGRPDWIELYNSGDAELSLSGWSITDDLDEPDKHVFGDLRIPAGGMLLLYADNQPGDGPDHLPFALKAEGEHLGLFRPDGGPEDLLLFDRQAPDRSVARVPDGAASWQVLETPTPLASNGGHGAPEPDDRAAVAIEEVPGSSIDDSVLFADDVLPDFDVELSEEAMDQLRAAPYEYVSGALVYDGRRYEPVGVRTKGENSWESIDEKPSLKVKLDKYDEGPGSLLGLTEITLQNMDNDPTLMHERLAYRIYREAGLAASRATHATVSINGESRGLYTHLETVDPRMLARHFDDPDGSLFEQWDVDYTDAYVGSFLHEAGPEDRTHIQGVADAMERSTVAARVSDAADHLSWDSFRLYWAVGAVVGQFDAYPYSSPGDDCHVYVDPDTDVLHYIPHGADETFSSSSTLVETAAGGLLSSTCRADAACRAAWVAEVATVLDLADDMDLVAMFDEVQAQVEPLILADTHKPWTNAQVTAGQAAMREFIVTRRTVLTRQLGLD